MTPLNMLLLLGIGPALALVVGSLGVALIDESILGWLLFMAGACYPPGAVIYYRHRRVRKRP
jgi:pilus assembly protein TadC